MIVPPRTTSPRRLPIHPAVLDYQLGLHHRPRDEPCENCEPRAGAGSRRFRADLQVPAGISVARLSFLGQDVILRDRVRTDVPPIAPTDLGEAETRTLDCLKKPRLSARDAFFGMLWIESQTGTDLVAKVENRRSIAHGDFGGEVEQEHANEG